MDAHGDKIAEHCERGFTDIVGWHFDCRETVAAPAAAPGALHNGFARGKATLRHMSHDQRGMPTEDLLILAVEVLAFWFVVEEARSVVTESSGHAMISNRELPYFLYLIIFAGN